MSKRLNIILPETTAAALDHVTTPGNRSKFIDKAVRHFIATKAKASLRERLKQEALANAERDLAMAAEWFPLEDEASEITQISRGRRPRKHRRVNMG
jgi:CopG family transcriptional regulator/antitoxin EndoAI